MAERLVLLVEDNPDEVELMRAAFQRASAPWVIRHAQDGVEALELLHGDTPIEPEFVLLDLKLPRVSGLEVLRRLRADLRTRRLPVFVLSSSNLEADIDAVKLYGADRFLRKPTDFIEFVALIAQLVRNIAGGL